MLENIKSNSVIETNLENEHVKPKKKKKKIKLRVIPPKENQQDPIETTQLVSVESHTL
jgi:hypothetical protein